MPRICSRHVYSDIADIIFYRWPFASLFLVRGVSHQLKWGEEKNHLALMLGTTVHLGTVKYLTAAQLTATVEWNFFYSIQNILTVAEYLLS